MERLIGELVMFSQGLECLGDTGHAKEIMQAVSIMEKYQQIEKILEDAPSTLYFRKIREVMTNE